MVLTEEERLGGYSYLYGRIIHQAVIDYAWELHYYKQALSSAEKYKLKYNQSRNEKHKKKASYFKTKARAHETKHINAKAYLFSKHQLETYLKYYGIDNLVSISYLRKYANKMKEEVDAKLSLSDTI